MKSNVPSTFSYTSDSTARAFFTPFRARFFAASATARSFTSANHIEQIQGVYVPFWLFDSDADADLTFNATRVRTWSDRDYNYTETEHFLVSRSGSIGFDHIPVDGSKKMPDDLMESIEPYDFSEAVDFRTAYLAGFFADKYDVTAV